MLLKTVNCACKVGFDLNAVLFIIGKHNIGGLEYLFIHSTVQVIIWNDVIITSKSNQKVYCHGSHNIMK